MKKFFMVLLLAVGAGAIADVHSPYTSAEQFSRDGRDVKITLLFGNPIKIFVSGKEKLRFDTSKLKVEFRPKVGGAWQELKINEAGNYYAVESTDADSTSKSMEVKTTVKNKKSEVFKFKKP